MRLERATVGLNTAPKLPVGSLVAQMVPPWMRIALIGGAVWTAVALVRGVTFALTHAAHGM